MLEPNTFKRNVSLSRTGSAASAALLMLLLAGCGGGGGSSAPASSGPLMTGTAASGAPIANGTVTITCNDGTTRTGTTGTDGSFSVDISGCDAPYVVAVTGPIGDTRDTLISVQPTGPAAGGNLTVNVNHITHAMAALAASNGDPFELVRNYPSEKDGITSASVANIKQSIGTALGNILAAAGESSTFDPINSAFSADGTKFDKVLDNLKVEVQASGINVTNIAAATVDDMAAIANGGTAPALPANTQLSFTKANFTTALATALPADVNDNGVIDAAQAALNACFAAPAAQRGTFASPGAACLDVPVATDYLNDGKNGGQEFNGFLTNPKMDGAKFAKPEIIRFFSPQRALVKLSALRTDGVMISFRTVAENSPATGNTWELRGNRRPYFMFVNGVVERRIQLPRTGAIASSFTSGLNIYFDFNVGNAGNPTTGVEYVRVKGPGLPVGGQLLRPGPTGCDEYFVVTNAAPGTPLANTQPCTSYLRLASKALDGSPTDPNAALFGSAPQFAPAPVDDATIVSSILPFAAYIFEVHKRDATVLTYVERLRGRPVPLSAIDNLRWGRLSDATIASMIPGTADSFGGGSFPMSWVPQPNTPPTHHVQAQFRASSSSTLVQDARPVPITATSVLLDNNGVAPFPAATNLAGGFQFAQLVSRTRTDLQLFSNWKY